MSDEKIVLGAFDKGVAGGLTDDWAIRMAVTELRDTATYTVAARSRRRLAKMLDGISVRARDVDARWIALVDSITASRRRVGPDELAAYERVKFWADRVDKGAPIYDDLQTVIGLANAHLNADAPTE